MGAYRFQAWNGSFRSRHWLNFRSNLNWDFWRHGGLASDCQRIRDKRTGKPGGLDEELTEPKDNAPRRGLVRAHTIFAITVSAPREQIEAELA